MSDKNLYHRVLKCESDRFLVDIDGAAVSCPARKKFKSGDGITVGDFVTVKNTDGILTVEEVLKRRNKLIRPAVANIDQLIIVVAPVPKTDFLLTDKLIINAARQNLQVILCLNKTDLPSELSESLQNQYKDVVANIIYVSAKEGDLEDLKEALKGKLSCFAGQSAVGKSSLINALLKSGRQTVGDISEKAQRGKNTTTKAEIIMPESGTYIIDTPGFYMLDIHDIPYNELDLYYPEFLPVIHECRYHRCTHSQEPGCRVREAAETEEINSERFKRYLQLFNELKSVKKY